MIITNPARGHFQLSVEAWDWNKGAKEDLEEMKLRIPSEHRSYDHANKQWIISTKYHQIVSMLFRRYNPTTETGD